MDTNESLLSDLEQEIAFEPASVGVRFANYLIDGIAFYVFLFIIGTLLGTMPVQNEHNYYEEESLVGSPWADFLFIYLIYVLYYSIFEGLTKGKTLGKLITGTVAVQENGDSISWKDALLRSLGRIVPFEPFSAFGRAPWHDSWTKTLVIKKNR